MTTIKDEYIFTSRVKSLGEQQNNEGWRLELEWKLPGSKFPLSLYGMDWEDVGGRSKWGAGSTPEIHIAKGNLKNDKDGRYTSDYFWDLTYIAEPGDYDPPDTQHVPSEPQPPRMPSRTGPPEPQRGALTRPDDVQTRIDIGMAFNAAYTLIANTLDTTGLGMVGRRTTELRTLRDQIYREVIQKGVAPEGYCYLHEEHCQKSQQSDKWGHQIDDGVWCVDGVVGIPEGQESPLVQAAMGMGATVPDITLEDPNLEDQLQF